MGVHVYGGRRARMFIVLGAAALILYLLVVSLSGNVVVNEEDTSVAPLSSAALSRHQKKERRVALLIYGVRLETLFETGKSIRRFVVDETNADVFVYGREVGEYNTTGAIKAAFGNTVKGIFMGRQMEEAEVMALLHLSKRWPELEKVCGGTNLLKSGTLLGLIWSELVFELARSYERVQGFEYDYMIFMRPDVQWFAPFPKLSLLDAKHQIWLPTRTPWGGIPASLVVCPRGLCENWAHWWPRLRNGTLVDVMTKKNVLTPRNCLMSEMFEYAAWNALEVPFGWFSVIHAIVCTKSLCKNGDQCYLGVSICSPGQKYKYDGEESWFEATLALKNAARIRKNGWKESEMRYNCYITTEIVRQFRRDFKRTGKKVPLPIAPDANALHPPPPWSPVDVNWD